MHKGHEESLHFFYSLFISKSLFRLDLTRMPYEVEIQFDSPTPGFFPMDNHLSQPHLLNNQFILQYVVPPVSS